MKVIQRLPVTDAMLTAASIPENDHPAFDMAATYDIGDRVITPATHEIYEAQSNGLTGKDPLAAANVPETEWLLISATNRWRAFDTYIADPAEAVGEISYTLTVQDLVGGIALFGLAATEVEIETSLGASTVTQTRSLIYYDELTDLYDLFHRGPGLLRLALFDVPWLGPGTQYRITIRGGTGDTVRVGQIVLGWMHVIGETRWGAEPGFISNSRVTRTAAGRAEIVKRAPRRKMRVPVQVRSGSVEVLTDLMETLDATPCVFVGDDDVRFGLVVYGIPLRFDPLLQTNDFFTYILEVDGLI